MPNIPFYNAGGVGVNLDLPTNELDPVSWSDCRNVRFKDGKAIRAYGSTVVFGTPLAVPFWLMPIQNGQASFWIYSGLGVVGNDSFTKVLLHADGVDAATAFPDTNNGGAAHTWTARGNAQIDTAQFVFGSASLLCDGTGDWIDTPDHADYVLGTSDFSIDFRFRVNGGDGALLYLSGQNNSPATAAGSSFIIQRLATNVIRAQLSDGAGFTNLDTVATYTTAVNTGWHHLEFTRSGGNIFLFIDGVQAATSAFAGTVPNSASILSVGAAGAIPTTPWNGWIDEFRLSVGISRNAVAFTSPVDAYGLTTEANLYITDGASHANATRIISGIPTPYTVSRSGLWNGGTLAQIPIITNNSDVPQMMLSASLAANFENLTAWPSTDRCAVIKPFKSFMVAMNITRSGNVFEHLVKWSHPAVPGAVPSSWDETDPTLLAGEVELLDELPGGIRDGLGLRDTFIIYKDNSTWGMQFIGGPSLFRFYPIFLQSGIQSSNCVVEINNGAAHFVATGDDFIVHDGQNARRVFTKRIRSYILKTQASAILDTSFCVAKHRENEVWFCFPEVGGEYPTLAAVYNWQEDTCSIRELPNAISHADAGPGGASSDPWDLDSLTWDSDATLWDVALFSAHSSQIIGTNPLDNNFSQLDDEVTYGEGFLERTGLALVGQDRVTGAFKADNEVMKLVDRIWIKAKGDPINVRLGSQQFIEDTAVFEPAQTFTPGVDKYLDFLPVQGRFMAVRFNWIGSGGSEITGYDLNVVTLGDQ